MHRQDHRGCVSKWCVVFIVLLGLPTNPCFFPANACEHKSGKHEWNFELHGPSVNEYVLPSNIDEKAEDLVGELRQTFKSLHEVSTQIPRLSGDQWVSLTHNLTIAFRNRTR